METFGAGAGKEGYEHLFNSQNDQHGSEADEVAAAKALNAVLSLGGKAPKYVQMLQEVADLQRTSITLELDDLLTVRCIMVVDSVE